ncbi:MAG TPA: excinuclease ABC subunit UvrC [Kofleriaceae bacterium]|jgi:excinuclease ABC subunit C|nr:excinuclease ABC subunit UvrC [Kofleriaceae bacterium]
MAELPADLLDRIPTDPGVYVMKDGAGKVIYVGKAKNLRTRVRQYFRPGGDERFFVAAGYLGRVVADIDTVVVTDEKEALLLENHLIKKHQPRFNVKLRDDKQYLVLRVVPPDPSEDAPRARRFPRVEVGRNIKDDGARYFGPYHSATSCRETLRVLNRHFQLRTCTDHVIETRGRTCLQYQIKRCPGPCALPVDPAAYAEQVADVNLFLEGRDKELVARLRERMASRAAAEEYEVAARLRDSIAAVERTVSRQHVVQEDLVDQDVFGMHREGDAAELAVMFVRGGKMVGKRSFAQRDQELPDAEVIGQFVQQYYATGTFIPDEIVVPVELPDAEVMAEWLGSARGRKVKLVWPQRGTRVRLLELATKNAEAAMVSRRDRGADTRAALEKLQSRLGLRRLPNRIECFDIAHVQGTETVASMVTFVDGVPERKLYRTFKVRTSTNDDFASMYEVLSRRFKRAAGRTPGDADPWAPPDLLVIDGGKGQLGMAVAALKDLGFVLDREDALDVISLAKERELAGGDAPDRVYLRNVKDPVALRANTAELFLLARLRDEAHRFANTFHRERRGKAMLRSSLDDIKGIGKTRRTALLKHFGSVAAIAAASADELARAPGMNRASAAAVRAFFDASGADGAAPPVVNGAGAAPEIIDAGEDAEEQILLEPPA